MSDGTLLYAPRRASFRLLDTREAALDDLINDPIAVLLRRSDNITLNDVRAALRLGAGGRGAAEEAGGGR